MNKSEIAVKIAVIEKQLTELQVQLRDLYQELYSDVVNENVAERYRS